MVPILHRSHVIGCERAAAPLAIGRTTALFRPPTLLPRPNGSQQHWTLNSRLQATSHPCARDQFIIGARKGCMIAGEQNAGPFFLPTRVLSPHPAVTCRGMLFGDAILKWTRWRKSRLAWSSRSQHNRGASSSALRPTFHLNHLIRIK
jgi:hypothetical protein